MENLLLTFTLSMQKQDYYYCPGYVSQVLQNPKARRSCRYWMINYKQRWFEKMIARKDEPIFQEPEAVAQSCSVKKVLLEISQNSQENTCARVFFLINFRS